MTILAFFTFQINQRENWLASMLRPLVVTPDQVENAEEPEDDHEEDDGDGGHLEEDDHEEDDHEEDDHEEGNGNRSPFGSPLGSSLASSPA